MLVQKDSGEIKAMASGIDIDSDQYKKTTYSNDTRTNSGYSHSITDEEVQIQIVVESIENEIKQVPSSPAKYAIYRVLKPLREVKPEAYTPRLVSIGPFHHFSKHLRPMEAHKLRLLKYFLDQRSHTTLPDCVREMRKIENEARQYYSEVITLKKDEFVRMLVIDGCFLLELIIGWEDRRQDLDEPIFNEIWMPQIIRDLLLLENQLPFFVLKNLYMLYRKDDDSIYRLTETFLRDFLPQSSFIIHKGSIPQRFCNWVESIFHSSPSESKKDRREFLVNKSLSSDVLGSPSELKIDSGESPDTSPFFRLKPQIPQGGASHLLDYVRYLLVSDESKVGDNKQPQRIYCATELKKATVKFAKSNTTLFSDITFKEGVLRIPAIHIDDLTESLLRNLIALEQSHRYDAKYVTAYAVFMDDLINSPEDVKLLQDEEILENLINLEDLAALFHKILIEVTQPNELCFSHIYCELDSYYNNPWHKLLAKVHQHMGSLKSKYFKNTWSFISFIAATALLGLTIAQTVASFMNSH
ncbi:UPF0481 protein At3g47200-like [Telopea speciosissima]|uniref:UPF0481 protein At3g47200-like n=1 Tax=Telopea speciosissima TaxID=54955 RepID=UPI001CC59CF8|nr:UPF0481 protein At3g47200-like [Telopea speciosissima]